MKKKSTRKHQRFVFDLDGVLCTQTTGDYEKAKPVRAAIQLVNKLYKSGHVIVIHTARFMNRAGGDAQKARRTGYVFTRKQLAGWGVLYHQLVFGKPPADVLIDDRALFFIPDWKIIKRRVKLHLKRKHA